MNKFAALVLAAGALSATGADAAPQPALAPVVIELTGSKAGLRPVVVVPHPSATTAASTSVYGTLELTLTIHVVSTLPGASIYCSLDASVLGVGATGTIDTAEETDQVLASVTGSTATCRMTIPYLWHLYATDPSALSPDMVSLSYGVTALDSLGDGRTSLASFAMIPLPNTGAITSYSLSGAL